MLHKYITVLDYNDKTLLVLSASGSVFSFYSFASVAAAPIEISSVTISLLFLEGDWNLKMWCGGKKHRANAFLARTNLESIQKVIFMALTDAEFSHEKFFLVSKEAENYLRLKHSIRTKDNQQGDIERGRLMEYSWRIGVNEILSQNKSKFRNSKQKCFRSIILLELQKINKK